jgi:hypothetical protein
MDLVIYITCRLQCFNELLFYIYWFSDCHQLHRAQCAVYVHVRQQSFRRRSGDVPCRVHPTHAAMHTQLLVDEKSFRCLLSAFVLPNKLDPLASHPVVDC